MPILKLRNLGSIGLNTDLAPESANPLAFTDVQNMSFYDQMPQKAKGYISGVFPTIPITPYAVMAAQGPTDYTWIVAGLEQVYAYFNGNLIDITRVSATYTGSQFIPWTGAWVNGVSFLNNGVNEPQYVGTIEANSKLQPLPGWPAGDSCRCLRSFKNYIIALDVFKGGVRYPTLFKWSHPADPGQVPPSWDETDSSYLAGEFPISATPGRLVDGLALKNSFIVYKSDGIIAVRETGGNDIFRFDTLSAKFGVPAVNCVTEFQPGLHAFITQTGDLMINNGQGIRSIATNKVKKLIQATLNNEQIDKSYCFTDVRNTEVVFCFVTEGNEWPTFAVTWNWEEDTFGTRSLPPMSMASPGKYNLVVNPGESWDSDNEIWDDDIDSWDGITANVISNRVLGVSPETGGSYLLGQGYTADGDLMVSYVQRRTLPLSGQDANGNLTVDPRAVKLILRVWPIIQVDTEEEFIVRIGVQNNSTGNITWQTTNTFRPREDEFLEFFCEGRYISYHIQNTGTTNWKLIGFDIELILNGENF